MKNGNLWERYKEYLYFNPDLNLMVDISRMNFSDDYFPQMEASIQRAFKDMDALESGKIANPDEKRMVGHYWLRSPELAPGEQIRQDIRETLRSIKEFARRIHDGRITSPDGKKFIRGLVIGIGGSALGPQLLADALKSPRDPLKIHFFDNTDPDGFDWVLEEIGARLAETLVVVVSKSGGTKETRNGMMEARAFYRSKGIDFEKCAVAITGTGSELDRLAQKDRWLARFPMWDWVGGRTSVTSAVGLLPAALQGIDIEGLIEGARLCDAATRNKASRTNPAAMLALMWYHATKGKGEKDMVILPYKDRLSLFAKYLQQLVMESLGKEKDLSGKVVHQGIAVYGNKGSTDQHAYVQQLREGVPNFFATFIEVLKDREGSSTPVDPGVTSGDYLNGFYQGTRKALFENGRESISISIERLDARSLGTLIALYERAVGFYASLVNLNAYHQPGVEAGKKAAERVIQIQGKALAYLRERREKSWDVEEVASGIGAEEEVETVFKVLEHAAANGDHGITRQPAPIPFQNRYQCVQD